MHHFSEKCAHVCTFLLQNGALWDVCQMHCGICEMSLFPDAIHSGVARASACTIWGVPLLRQQSWYPIIFIVSLQLISDRGIIYEQPRQNAIPGSDLAASWGRQSRRDPAERKGLLLRLRTANLITIYSDLDYVITCQFSSPYNGHQGMSYRQRMVDMSQCLLRRNLITCVVSKDMLKATTYLLDSA